MSTDTLTRIRAPFAVKSLDEDARTFEGYASTWDLDLGDDVIHRGAFRDSLKAWRTSGQAMPLLNSHDYFDIMSALGQMVDAKEDERGLWSKWEVIDGPDGDRALARMRPSKRTGRAVVGAMSIGYQPIKYDYEDSAKAASGQIRNLRAVGLRETSLVLFPMNTTSLIDVASVKMMAAEGMLTPEARAGLSAQVKALESLMVSAPEIPVPPSVESVDAPDTTLLDHLRVRRMRLMA